MRRTTGITAIFLLTLLFLAGCGKKPDIVAKVGQEKVTLKQFKTALSQEYSTNELDKISLKDRQKVVQEFIDRRLRVIRARELHLDQDPDFIKEVTSRKNNLMAQKLYEDMIVNKLIPEDLIRLIFDLKQHKIQAIAIVLGYTNAEVFKANRSKEEAVTLANQLVTKIEHGEDMKELSATYSDPAMIKNKKGVLDSYNPGMLDLAVDKQIITAKPDQLLGPIVTSRGIFIVKVLENRKMPSDLDYQTDKPEIKRMLYQKFFRGQGEKMYQEITEQFKQKLGTEINDDVIKEFVKTVREWAKTQPKDDSSFPAAEKEKVLGKVGDQEVTVGYFLDQFRGRFHQFYKRYDSPEKMRRILENHFSYLAWVEMAKERGYDKKPEIAENIAGLERSKLLELFEKKVVREQVKITDDDLRTYYQAHKDQFVEPRKIHLWEIAVKDKNLADKIYRMALKGRDFEALARQYSEKPIMKKRGGDLGYQSEKSSSLGNLVKIAFQAGPGQILQPIPQGAYYYVLKTGDMQPARQKALDEVRSRVEGMVKRQKETEMRRKILAELRKKHPFWVNDYLVRNL